MGRLSKTLQSMHGSWGSMTDEQVREGMDGEQDSMVDPVSPSALSRCFSNGRAARATCESGDRAASDSAGAGKVHNLEALRAPTQVMPMLLIPP